MAETPEFAAEVDDTGSALNSQTLGNKADAPSDAVTASAMARIKKIGEEVGLLAFKLYWAAELPDQINLNDYVLYAMHLQNRETKQPIPSGDITAGTYDVVRIRSGAETTIVNDASFSKADGLMYAVVFSDPASFQDGDGLKVVPNNDSTVTIGVDVINIPQEIQVGTVRPVGSRAHDRRWCSVLIQLQAAIHSDIAEIELRCTQSAAHVIPRNVYKA